jgi:hypothetical protein
MITTGNVRKGCDSKEIGPDQFPAELMIMGILVKTRKDVSLAGNI